MSASPTRDGTRSFIASASSTPVRRGLYFEQQARDDVLCVVHALNNLFGGPVVSVHDITKRYKTRDRRGEPTKEQACEQTARGGLMCSNAIVRAILEDVQEREVTGRYPTLGAASHPEVDSWEEIEAVEWRDLKTQETLSLLDYVRDSKHDVIGVYGNRTHNNVGHAACMVVTTRHGIWLKDSLDKSIQLVQDTTPIQTFVPYVLLRRRCPRY